MIPNYYEDVVEFDLPIDKEELRKVNYNWRQYNPRKDIRRYGCSITSLNGEDDGPDLDSLLQLEKKYKETDFCTPTIHAKPFIWFLENIDVGRSHYLKIPAGGYFPYHRDSHKGTFRIIYTIQHCTRYNLVWINDKEVLQLQNSQWYYINTKKAHAVFSFNDSIFAVFNVFSTDENYKKLYNYMKIV